MNIVNYNTVYNFRTDSTCASNFYTAR